MYVYTIKISTLGPLVQNCWSGPPLEWWFPYIYFCILKAFLQIIVYSFVRDFANQSKIGNSDLLFLSCVECGLLDIRFATAGWPTSTASLRIVGSFISLRTATYTLDWNELISHLHNGTSQTESHYFSPSWMFPWPPFTASRCAIIEFGPYRCPGLCGLC
jgi:hypothetical protein